MKTEEVHEYKNISIEIFECSVSVPRYAECIRLLHKDKEWFDTEEDYYQGDWFAVGVDKEGKWYYHQGTFGSCSGCDWHEGLKDLKDAKEYIDDMEKLVPIGTKTDAIAYLEETKKNLWNNGKKELQKCIDFINGEIKNEN